MIRPLLSLRCTHAPADLTFHAVAGMLVALTVINKGHFLYLWYIVLVFSTPQVLVDVSTFVAACVLGGKRRW